MFSSVLLFFEFTAPEIMLIAFVILLLFGGEKLPGLAKGLGKGIREFKDASEGIKREITSQIDSFETKKTEQTAAANTAETAVSQAPTPANEVPGIIEHHDNSVPVAEIGSIAAVEPVKVEEHTPAEPAHLKETPIERVVPEPANTAHEEHKS